MFSLSSSRCYPATAIVAIIVLPGMFLLVDFFGLGSSCTQANQELSTTGHAVFQSPWSCTGLPKVSLPAGRAAPGLPLCVRLAGQHWTETKLFATTAWCAAVLACRL